MNLVDLFIVMLLILGVLRGLSAGLLRQGFSVAGFFLGLLLGSLLAQWVVPLVTDPGLRAVAGLGITIGLGLILAGGGEWIGWRLRGVIERRRLRDLDNVLGAVFEVAAVVVSVWLLASLITRLPAPQLNRAINQSRIVQLIGQHLPPAPGVIARLEQLIQPNGFPRVFLGPEPTPTLGSPASQAEVQSAVAAAGASTVQIEGVGCGGLVEGSGFVAAENLVVTNAHVVAGVSRIFVTDGNGRHGATPIYFDPNLDVAVLRTSGLVGRPLAIDRREEGRGTTGAVLGYPEGGPFTAGPATELAERTAVGRNIYDQGVIARSIYELQADVEPGNSGGPFVAPDGTVIGLVFARSTDTAGVGYALTGPAVLKDLQQAEAGGGPVAAGSCASS